MPLTPRQIHDRLKARFGDAVEFKEAKPDAFTVVKAAAWPGVALALRDDAELAFDFLGCITGVHFPDRFESTTNLYSTVHRHKATIKVMADKDKPEVPSVARVWPAANWHERESYDLLGIVYTDHPDLKRILLPDDWVGHPLRKDYVFPDEYHGIPMK